MVMYSSNKTCLTLAPVQAQGVFMSWIAGNYMLYQDEKFSLGNTNKNV